MSSKGRLLAQAITESRVLSAALTETAETPSFPITKKYTNIDLLPSSGTIGDQAFVESTNRLYIWNGNGWYNIALINTNPSFDSGGTPEANYYLDSAGGTPTVIQLSANDPEGIPIQWSYVASDSAQYFADITNDSGVFTITAKPTSIIEQYDSTGGIFSVTFRASDGVNLATALSEFTITFSAGTDWTLAIQQTKLVASDAEAGDDFGRAVSISGDGNTAIVGAYLEDANGLNKAGAAYIFVKSGSTWGQQTKLIASDAQASNYFGFSVSISGDGNTAIIGSYGVGSYMQGAAYIFVRSGSTWTQQAKLAPSELVEADTFGKSVSISGDGNTVIVSADAQAFSATSRVGAVYIYVRSGSSWGLQKKIISPYWQQGAHFGRSVSISGDGNTVIVGSESHSNYTGLSYSGAAYIFVRSETTWSMQGSPLVSSNAQASDYFGWPVSISGDGNTVIVSAFGEAENGLSYSGAAYIFVKSGSTWSQQAKLIASVPEVSALFGSSVSISSDGNTVIVGANSEDPNSILNAGAVYIFTRVNTTWSQQAKLVANDKQEGDLFGSSVSISADGYIAIIGANLEDPNEIAGAGSAYIFVAG